MPTKKQLESTTLALRKSVARWNKSQLKLNKAQAAYDKGRKTKTGMALRNLVNRLAKAKREFAASELVYVNAGKKYRAVHSQKPHGHWMN
jgi:hypothetical protein